ncbi:MAG: type II toxin-antitoxin system VapC family toxin [Promethearchaeota archaeon]
MFVDSVYWIASKYKNDQWHTNAQKLKEKLKQADQIYITDYIMVETYNFLLRKITGKVALDTLEMFLTSPKIQIFYNNSVILNSSKKILRKHPHLSLTDVNIVWHCRNVKATNILSFDEGFDSVEDIERIY